MPAKLYSSLSGPFARQGPAIHLVGGHRVEGIDDRQDARAQRKLVAAQRKVAAAAVEPGRGMAHDVQDRRRGAAGFQNVQAGRTDADS